MAVRNYWRCFDTEHGQHPGPVGIDVQIFTGRRGDITWWIVPMTSWWRWTANDGFYSGFIVIYSGFIVDLQWIIVET